MTKDNLFFIVFKNIIYHCITIFTESQTDKSYFKKFKNLYLDV
jgi:hypothetical protein